MRRTFALGAVLWLLLTALVWAQSSIMFPGPSSVARVDATVVYQTSTGTDSAATTFTYNTQAVGTADGTRIVIVGVTGSGANSRTISSVTLTGNAMTQVVFRESGGGGAFVQSALYALAFPTGTTADVVVTFSGSSGRAVIGVWATYNLLSATATNTYSSVASPMTASMNITAGGIAVGMANGYDNGGFTSITWSNLTSRFNISQASTQLNSGGADAAFSTTQTGLSVSATMNGAPSPDLASGVFAAFR